MTACKTTTSQASEPDVHLRATDLADELLPEAGLRSRFDRDGPKCFRIVREELIAEDLQRGRDVVGTDHRGAARNVSRCV